MRKTGCDVDPANCVQLDGTATYTLTQDCRIGLYDIENFKEVRSFGSPYSDYAISFALSPDEKILAVALAKRFELWDVSSGKLVKKVDIRNWQGIMEIITTRQPLPSMEKPWLLPMGIVKLSNSRPSRSGASPRRVRNASNIIWHQNSRSKSVGIFFITDPPLPLPSPFTEYAGALAQSADLGTQPDMTVHRQ